MQSKLHTEILVTFIKGCIAYCDIELSNHFQHSIFNLQDGIYQCHI